MNNKNFNKGIALTALGSFWWGVIGVIYFNYISFTGAIEVVIHRCVWTSVVLIMSTIYFSKWDIFFNIITKKYITLLKEEELQLLCDLLDYDDENLYKYNQGLETTIIFASNNVTELFKNYIYVAK